MHKQFGPIHQGNTDFQSVHLTIDEHETIRLIDYLGLQQSECATRMNIGRTTAQRIYNDAKHKIADAIVNGKMIEINGGDIIYSNEYTSEQGKGQGRGQGNRGRFRKGFE
jgi:predicted DNA-binding protein (UPF0251 family)